MFSSRETPDLLLRNIDAASAALGAIRTGPTLLDVVINGQPALAEAVAARIDQRRATAPGSGLRIWSVQVADKAAAWNHYLHGIAPPASATAFIDGYVRLDAMALVRLTQTLTSSPEALAATGLPRVGLTAGRVARTLRKEGGLHGNLCALRAEAVQELRRSGFRLPLGIYRTDSLLGAALAFGLNLYPRQWQPQRRICISDAAWSLQPLRWWRWSDLQTHRRRVARQAQGDLEIAAIRDSYATRGRPLADLPRTAVEMIQRWMRECPEAAAQLLRRPAQARAWAAMSAPRDWSADDLPPVLLHPRPAARSGN